MRIVCLADLHGYLPPVPPCDVLVVAGDICPTDDERPATQRRWLRGTFASWLAAAPARVIVGTAGNHDFVGETDPDVLRELEWHYLVDQSVELDGVVFHGSPWTRRFQDWAFMLDEQGLAERWERIPASVDVLVVHSPPAGYGDRIGDESIGSPALRTAIHELAPALCVFGHVHEGYGRWRHGRTTLVNAAHCGPDYLPAHPPAVVDLA